MSSASTLGIISTGFTSSTSGYKLTLLTSGTGTGTGVGTVTGAGTGTGTG